MPIHRSSSAGNLSRCLRSPILSSLFCIESCWASLKRGTSCFSIMWCFQPLSPFSCCRFCHNLIRRLFNPPVLCYRFLFLRNAIGRSHLAFKYGLRVAGDQVSNGQQHYKQHECGPLRLLQTPVQPKERDDDVIAYKEEQELRDGIGVQVEEQEYARATHAAGQVEHYRQHNDISEQFIASRWLHRYVAGGRVQAGPAIRVLVDG